jgi:lysophospholipase L1-like esterase
LEVTNFSCPGETTATFITGGCPWRLSGFPVHDRYRGSQLAAAVALLREHRRDAGTITIAIWGNDVGALRSACGGDLACVVERAPAEIAAFSERLGTILRALQAAAPSADIAVLAAFHAFPPPTPEIDGLYLALNAAIREAANRSRVQIADVRPTFNPADDASRLDATCRYNLTCSTNGADGHPSDAGYAQIADAFAGVTRCARRGSR